jgi:two-component system sensor histidine kinase AlgZ
MIARLAEFLRATLERGDCHEHALADELALTESYLDIEKARLGERLVVSIQIGPEVLGALVPYLFLQPLVENAIRHGIAPRVETGSLTLQLTQAEGKLAVCVENDMAPAAAPSGRGIGLDNIASRLQQLYPGAHRFDTEVTAEGRYRVNIALPLRTAGAI